MSNDLSTTALDEARSASYDINNEEYSKAKQLIWSV